MTLTHNDLISIGRKWLLKPWRNAKREGHAACCLVLTDMSSFVCETPDVLGWTTRESILIECKVSVKDFKAESQKSFRRNLKEGVGIQRYYMVPKGLLDLDKLPAGWGLIEVSPEGKTQVKRASDTFEANLQAETIMLLSLIRRLKVEPGKHVAIRAYTSNASKEPRATVTFVRDTPE